MTVVLPPETYTRRAWLIGFWSVMSLGVGILTGVLLWGLAWPQRITLGSGLAVVMALAGFLRPQIATRPLQVWNGLARFFARGSTLWLTGIWFYVVLTAVGRVGSPLRFAPPPTNSLWTPWPAEVTDRRTGRQGIVMAGSSEQGWVSGFAAWAKRSHNAWALCLLPLLLVLSTLEAPRDVEAPPAGIYTLY